MLLGLFTRHWPDYVYSDGISSWVFVAFDVVINILLGLA